jgi:hypothetical protein
MEKRWATCGREPSRNTRETARPRTRRLVSLLLWRGSAFPRARLWAGDSGHWPSPIRRSGGVRRQMTTRFFRETEREGKGERGPCGQGKGRCSARIPFPFAPHIPLSFVLCPLSPTSCPLRPVPYVPLLPFSLGRRPPFPSSRYRRLDRDFLVVVIRCGLRGSSGFSSLCISSHSSRLTMNEYNDPPRRASIAPGAAGPKVPPRPV